jgi:WD40 repeat protein
MLPMEFAGCVLERRIARGGMGIVFAARQLRLGRSVAVKVLAAGLFAEPETRERFLAEVQAVARLEHPGIVPLLEAGEWEDQAYFIMPLLTGGSLAQEGRRHTPAEAAALVAPLARAVHYAHQRGVLHRDIKPGNILLDESGAPFLTDFGIARLVERGTVLTRTNALLGTPAYMAPEQAGNGAEVTTSTDVYGLGAVLYELLTGQPPFAGGTTMETVRQLLTKEPRRPSAVEPQVDRDLDTICLTCLEKDAAARYSSAAALAEDLERWQRGEPIAARHTGWMERCRKWMRRHPALAAAWTIAGLAVATALVVGTFLSWRLQQSRAASAALAESRRAEVARLHAAAVADHLTDHDAFGAQRAAAECLAMEEAATPGPARESAVARARERLAAVHRVSPRLLHAWKHDAVASSGTLSPDGRAAACLSGGRLHGYDTATGVSLFEPLTASTEQSLGYTDCVGFDASGTRVFAVVLKGGKLHVGMASLLEKRWLWQDREITAVPCFDSGGARLLAATPSGVRWLDAATGDPGPMFREGRHSRVALSPDGRWAAMSTPEGDLFIHDARSRECLHGPLRVRGLATVVDLNFSPDGRWFAACTGTDQGSGQFGVWEMPAAIPSPTAPESHNRDVWGVDFSPDSRRLLAWGFQKTRVRDPAEKAAPGEILARGGFVSMAAWSPDSSMVLTCGTTGSASIWDLGHDDETLMRLPHDGQVYTAAWGRDGKHILTAGSDGLLKLWELPARDFSLLKISGGRGIRSLSWSPDGSSLNAANEPGLLAWGAATGKAAPAPVEPPTPPGLLPGCVLSPDRALGAVCTGPNGEFDLVETASGRIRHRLRHPGRPGGTALGFAFSPDGSRVLSMARDPGTESCDAVAWDTLSGKSSGYRLTHGDDILAGTFSPDGKLIATAGVDTITRLWRAADGASLGELPRHGYWIWDVAFSPDGTRLATASADHTARVWDVRTLTAISAPLPHPAIVRHLAWHPDGTRLATGDVPGTIRIWETGF